MNRPARFCVASIGIYLAIAVGSINNAGATPQFARETDLRCNACHRHMPLLNEFGQKFYSNGFRLSKGSKLEKTLPVWATLGAQATTSSSLGSSKPVSWAPTEIASYGSFDETQLLYHLEYQPTEHQNYIYLLQPISKTLTVQAGEIGLLAQYDPRLDVNLSRPVFLSPGGAGPLGNGKTGPFAPGSNAYGVRANVSLSGDSAMPYSNGWQMSGAIPLSDEAPCGLKPTYSSDPTGYFGEIYRRIGMNSYGVNYFSGRDGRQYYGTAFQQKAKSLYFEGGMSFATFNGAHTGMASLATTWTPTWDKALTFRIDDQDGIFTLVPTLSLWLSNSRGGLRLIAESTITHGVGPTTVVSARLKF